MGEDVQTLALLLVESHESGAELKTRVIACFVSKCFCIFVVFPPLNEISTLQVALLSSVLIKYNQTFERLSRLGTKDVLQVTWQKISHDVETNVATYSKYYGQRVNDGFTDKVEFKYTGLQNCSIVIRNVTEQDEGCYHCLFNTYPEGSLTGKPCLHVFVSSPSLSLKTN
uniref:Immunoglobulin V-set domain-containing protein n=1 Tax=Maylandia zebra TaxID=106582 RepID=A0A3P9D4R1_9CICH